MLLLGKPLKMLPIDLSQNTKRQPNPTLFGRD